MTRPQLVPRLARLAAERGHGSYSTGRAYRPDEVAIVVDDVIDQPDRILVVRAYDGGDEPDVPGRWAEPRVQWRFRGGPDGRREDSARRAAAFIADMHGLGPLDLGGGLHLQLVVCMAPEPIPIGRDPAGRYEHTVNTRIEVIFTPA